MTEWLNASQIAALRLPHMPQTKANVLRAALREGWTLPEAEGRSWRRRAGRGGGVEFHVSVLPLPAQATLRLRAAPPKPATREAAKEHLSHAEAWDWFERLPEKKRAEAARRLQLLDAVAAMVGTGTPKVNAIATHCAKAGISAQTYYNWENAAACVPPEHRLPRLAPRHAGRREMRAECPPEALAWLRSEWLESYQPTVEEAIRRLRKVAPGKGWALPSDRTLRRHLDSIPRTVATYHRKGREAADRMFPMLRRDKSALHALEMVNADGHRFDVMVRWPDGVEARPMCTTFQDVYSGKVLSWRVDRSENTDSFRLAFGDVVEKFGIPDHVFVDNTLAAANKTMSGGVRRRFRFKVREEEPLGILPLLDVTVHFTRPYSGQSKPIERAFGDFARDIARHPAFRGAYLGNSTSTKPHDHGARAVPLDEFLAVLERGIADHNARPGRTGGVCFGRSFDEVYAESAANAPIRVATATQRRMFLLAADAVTVRQDATVHLHRNRYHHDLLADMIGAQIVVRFDPDNLHGSVHLYRLDGSYIAEAACWADTGFADTEAARRFAQARKQRRRGLKLAAEAQTQIDAAERARDLSEVEAAPLAEPARSAVVRGVFRTAGNAALKQRTHELEDDLPAATRAQVLALDAFFPAPKARPAKE
jgi:transposase InsO family protein